MSIAPLRLTLPCEPRSHLGRAWCGAQTSLLSKWLDFQAESRLLARVHCGGGTDGRVPVWRCGGAAHRAARAAGQAARDRAGRQRNWLPRPDGATLFAHMLTGVVVVDYT